MRLSVVIVVLWAATAAADPARVKRDRFGSVPTGSVCSGGEVRCFAHVHITPGGAVKPFAVPTGFGPTDLQSAYQIDPNITTAPTVAIVDAFGYRNLESDLAQYRAAFGLPACTKANGCLTIVNQQGQTAPLPADPPANDDWTVETALDADMVSAACPRCKILVVQATSDSIVDLYTAQQAAANANPAVISDSWGGQEPSGSDLTTLESILDRPGITTFAAAGDNGFDNGQGFPLYPSTSAHVVAVGGTSLVPSGNMRGWSETAWSDGGSSCSNSIPRPAFQSGSPCTFRAASDIAAVGDPATGLAVFNANSGGFITVGGTSAATPIVAAMFASIGKGSITAQQISQSTGAVFDVTAGSNGTCGNILCNAATGWDGPTGFGTPSATAFAGGGTTGGDPIVITITSPADGAVVKPGFTVTATITGHPVEVGLGIDGQLVATTTTPPYSFKTPANLNGKHEIEIAAIDSANNEVDAAINVTVNPLGGGGGGGGGGGETDNGDGGGGGCNASGNASSLLLIALIGLMRRRPRA